MNRKVKKNRYKGLGFVEALIGLTVSGVVAVVLMGISAEAIRELRKLDMQDQIALNAVSTSVHLQNLAIKEATTNQEDNLFYNLKMHFCYTFNNDGTINTASGSAALSRDDYKNSLIEEDSEYFRVMCVEHNTTEGDRRKILVKVVTGSNRVDGRVTNDYDVKDYEYYSIINL